MHQHLLSSEDSVAASGPMTAVYNNYIQHTNTHSTTENIIIVLQQCFSDGL